MAESDKKSMISEMDSLLTLSGEEFLEAIRLEADGKYKNYRLLVSKIRNNAGLSAYEVALQNGFIGTQEQWLASLVGKSAYEIAVESGFVGTEAEFIASLKGTTGDTGESIYDIAVADGFIGTEADFLKTLVGKSAYQTALDGGFVGTEAEFIASLKGVDGTDGVDGTNGLDGASAYETYKTLPGNANKTEAEFIESLKGTDGVDGIDGSNGQSAYDAALAADPTIGTEAQWLASLNGDSAYQIAVDDGFVGDITAWLASLKGADGVDGEDGATGASAFEAYKSIPGNENKTEADFIVAITGPAGNDGIDGTNGVDGTNGEDGADGASAYDTYKALPGNAGKTEAEFIESLKGDKGDDGIDGTNGTNGLSAYEVAQGQGFVGTRDQWLESLVGAAGNDGAAGKAINVVATITDVEFAEIVAAGTALVADAYIVDEFIYVFNGVDWVKSNSIQGPKGTGLSYLGEWPQAAPLPLDENYVAGDTYIWRGSLWTLSETPERKWVDIGVPGPQGKSAYQTYIELPGNSGKTEAEFIESIKGEKGDPGNDGTNGSDGEDGLPGESAYEAWLGEGNTGSEADFLLAIKGEQGIQGEPAIAFTIKAKLTDVSELPVTGVPTEAYYVGRDLYVWIDDTVTPANSKFENFGSLNGASAYETWLELPGNAGKTEAEFITAISGTNGIDGVDGVDGRNLQILGTKADEAAVRATPDPEDQDAYVTLDLGHLWIYVGTAWIDAGKFRGADGTNGTDGLDGASAFETWLALPGNAGKTEAEFITAITGPAGEDGVDGTNGTDGRNVQILGAVANFAALPTTPAQQDAYTLLDTGHLWMYIATAWVDLGQFKGDKGDPGEQGSIGLTGQGINIRGEVEFDADLPSPGDQAIGDAYWSLESRKLFQVNEAGTYNPGIDISGVQGEQGIRGLQGAAGQSITILGTYSTSADLIAAHPTGPEAAAYLVGNNLWIYGANPTGGATEWYDAGPVVGPQGEEGPQGIRGLQGLQGIRGERGAFWLVLADETPPNASIGKVGDWAVSPSFSTYYKQDENTWIPMGRLVAGDVNSPPGALGKVVRLGTEWVALPVDEVVGLTAGKIYGRQAKSGSTTEGEWVEIVFPTSFPEPTADNILYGRRRAVGDTNGAWVAVPAGIADITEQGTKQWARAYGVGDGAPSWKEIVVPAAGIPEAPTTAGATYLRSGQNNAWVQYTGISAPPGAGKYLRTTNTWVAFNTYDVLNQTLPAAATAYSWDLTETQVLDVDNTTAGAGNRVITLGLTSTTGLPAAGRSETAVAFITGSVGTVSFTLPAGLPAGSVFIWNGNVQPVYQAGFNVVTILVVVSSAGVVRAIASLGGQTPSTTPA